MTFECIEWECGTDVMVTYINVGLMRKQLMYVSIRQDNDTFNVELVYLNGSVDVFSSHETAEDAVNLAKNIMEIVNE